MNLCAYLALVVLACGGDGPCPDEGDEKPVPRKESIDKFKKAETGGKEAEVEVDLVVSEPICLPVTTLPLRVVSDNTEIADHLVEFKPVQEIMLRPKKVGRTKVEVTFGDPGVKEGQFTVTVLVRVRPKP
jgi:hypothetical protein